MGPLVVGMVVALALVGVGVTAAVAALVGVATAAGAVVATGRDAGVEVGAAAPPQARARAIKAMRGVVPNLALLIVASSPRWAHFSRMDWNYRPTRSGRA